jgi:hypothetical protein
MELWKFLLGFKILLFIVWKKHGRN